jgi:hypothetical protein
LLKLQRFLAPVTCARWVVLHQGGQKGFIINDLGLMPTRDLAHRQDGFAIPIGRHSVVGIFPQPTRTVKPFSSFRLAVAVPGDRHRVDPLQLGLPAGDRPPVPVGGAPSAELFPAPVALLHQQAGHPSAGEVIQRAEGLLRDRVPEESGPAAHD